MSEENKELFKQALIEGVNRRIDKDLQTEETVKKPENKTHLNPCPKCGKTWLFYDKYDRLQYKVNCNCGFAWRVSRWKNTAKEAAEEYNKKVKVRR